MYNGGTKLEWDAKVNSLSNCVSMSYVLSSKHMNKPKLSKK